MISNLSDKQNYISINRKTNNVMVVVFCCKNIRITFSESFCRVFISGKCDKTRADYVHITIEAKRILSNPHLFQTPTFRHDDAKRVLCYTYPDIWYT